MQSSVSFMGLSLTQIFEIQPIQSLLIKFWYLGLTSQSIIAKDDQQAFKPIKKTVTFPNCFTFQMPIKTYINYIERIMITIQEIDPKKIFNVLLSHLKENKIITISFELFGVAFLQLFGRLLQSLNSQVMTKILRKIYVQLTTISKNGTAILKPDIKMVKQIALEEMIANFKEILVEASIAESKKPQQSPEKDSISFEVNQDLPLKDLHTIKGRLQSQRHYNSNLRDGQPDQYPIGQRMRMKQKTNLSCFMMGGFEIVDYSDSINQLHRKLLTKILLNK